MIKCVRQECRCHSPAHCFPSFRKKLFLWPAKLIRESVREKINNIALSHPHFRIGKRLAVLIMTNGLLVTFNFSELTIANQVHWIIGAGKLKRHALLIKGAQRYVHPFYYPP